MAQFDVPINVPDAKVQELLAALNWKWTPDGQGGMTPAELRANLKMRVGDMLKQIYREHKEHLSKQAADTDIDVT